MIKCSSSNVVVVGTVGRWPAASVLSDSWSSRMTSGGSGEKRTCFDVRRRTDPFS